MAELDGAMARILENPEAWPPFDADARHYLLPRFPYFVVYRTTTDTIQVVAVMHAKRRPGYWSGR